MIEGRKTELELSASDAHVSIFSCDRRQPIIAKPPDAGGVFKYVRCSDSSNGTCIQVEVSDVIRPFVIELYVYLGKQIYM